MKISVKKYLLLLLSLFTSTFISCFDVPDEVILPEWDVDLNVPITNRTYTLEEMIKPQDHIVIDTAGNNDIFLLQSGKYSMNSSLSEFVQIEESSSLENIPTVTSDDSFIVYVRFPEGIEVESSEFASGIIKLNVNNPSAEDVSLILKIPAFFDTQGNSIIMQSNVAAGQSKSINYDLEGYKYEIPSDQPAELRNSFRTIVKALSNHPGNVAYTDVSMSDLAFKYMTGVIPSKSIDNTITADFDVNEIEEYRDKSFLRDAKLNLRVNYLSSFNDPNELDIRNLNIVAKRNDGSEFYLKDKLNNKNFTVKLRGSKLDTSFTEANSNITDFIIFLPDSVILRAEYVVNPGNNVGTFSSLDSIKFETDFSTRSYLALKETAIEDQTSIEISEETRVDIRDGIEADINFEIENGIPLVAAIKIDVLDENKNYLFTLTENNVAEDSLLFEAALVDTYGEVTQPTLNPVKTITLDKSRIQLFSRAHYLNYKINFSTTNSSVNPPQIVAIRPSNWIKLKTYGKIKYKISTDD